MSFLLLTYHSYHRKLQMLKTNLQYYMVTGKHNIPFRPHMHMCLSEKWMNKIPSCIDNLYRGLTYLTNLTHKLGGILNIYINKQPHMTHIDTQKHNSYTCGFIWPTSKCKIWSNKERNSLIKFYHCVSAEWSRLIFSIQQDDKIRCSNSCSIDMF